MTAEVSGVNTETAQHTQDDVAVFADGLTKRYGNNDGVDGLDLSIPRGCKFGLLGPNGAGKSTTLKMMMGIIEPDAGHLNVLGNSTPASSPSLRSRIGYVPERHHIYQWMTIGEVIRFTRAFYPTWNDAFCDDLLRQYGLTLEKRVGQLSHGMLTKLALILALSHEPELLVLDEPTTGLDPIVREEFLEGILHPLVEQSARTVIFSSHIMSDIETVSDTIAIINEGRLLVCRSKQELLNRTKRIVITLDDTKESYLKLEGTVMVQREEERRIYTIDDFKLDQIEALRKLDNVRSVDVHDMSLEEVFKDFVKGARTSK